MRGQKIETIEELLLKRIMQVYVAHTLIVVGLVALWLAVKMFGLTGCPSAKH